MTYDNKTIPTLLFASVATIIILNVAYQSAEAQTSCPPAGLNDENRCYATKRYTPTTSPDTINVDIISDDISVSNGLLQNSLWTHLSNSRFVEAGFHDQSSNSEKIICGVDGGISGFTSINFADGHTFNTYSIKLTNGASWKTGIKHFNSNSERACTLSTPSGTTSTKFLIGSEATRPDNPNYEHDWNDLEINYVDVASTNFSSTFITEAGPGYDVQECGSGNEPYRHIQTGKGGPAGC